MIEFLFLFEAIIPDSFPQTENRIRHLDLEKSKYKPEGMKTKTLLFNFFK